MRKILILVILFLFILNINLSQVKDYSLDWELSEDDIEDALNLGRILARWDHLQTLFFEEGLYTIYYVNDEYPENCDVICIYTPFLKIVEANMFYYYSNNCNMPKENVNEILSDKNLEIQLYVLYTDKNSIKDYTCFIKIDNRIISPTNIAFGEPTEIDSYLDEKLYRNRISFIFSLKDIPKDNVSLVIMKENNFKTYDLNLFKLK